MSDRRRRRRLWILKLGGSLVGSPHLQAWLDAIAEGGGRLVVVPGGGPFADAVRDVQTAQGIDDVTAHRMALLAMEQYAAMLGDGGIPHLPAAAAGGSGRGKMRYVPISPATSRRAIVDALSEGRVPVWLPSRMVLANADIAASWDVTSDSLAAWLAGELRASALILVKAVAPGGASAGASAADALVRQQIVDRAFPEYLARCGCECRIVGAAEHGVFRMALRDGKPPGVRVL